MSRRRTTARAFLVAASGVAAVTLGGVAAATPSAPVPRLVFPVVGPVTYHDDFGDPRGEGWSHPGNDLLAARRAVAVAAEPGTVRLWTTSASAGCMLYLYGESGTTYQYIHLNNDLTNGNDNRGRCVAGTAYAPGLASGDRVGAGEPVGFVGDSGDANGIHPHLHFEVHPNDGPPSDPYPFLRRAAHLLFPVSSQAVTLTITGVIAAATGDRLTVRVAKLRAYPATTAVGKPAKLVLALPSAAQVDDGSGSLADASAAARLVGSQVVVLTQPARATLDVALGRPGAIAASRVSVTP